MILRSWRGDQQTRFEGGKAENKLRVQREFETWMKGFEKRGAIVDSPMGWMRDGVNWFVRTRRLLRHSLPAPLQVDVGARRWKIARGSEGLEVAGRILISVLLRATGWRASFTWPAGSPEARLATSQRSDG